MKSKAKIIGSIVILPFVVQKAVEIHVGRCFTDVFGAPLNAGRICLDRTTFKNDFNNLLHLNGMVFVCARPNGGKKVAIEAALADRKHVAVINWRSETIHDSKTLSDAMIRTFHIFSVKNSISSILPDLPEGLAVISTLATSVVKWIRLCGVKIGIIPNFPSRSDVELDQTFRDIEVMLKFAAAHHTSIAQAERFKHSLKSKLPVDWPWLIDTVYEICALLGYFPSFGDCVYRPVLYFKELGVMADMFDKSPETAKSFVNWLVYLKEQHICDIIIAGSNGFLLEHFNLTHKCRTVIVHDFSNEDVDYVLSEQPHLVDALGGIAKEFISEVGGHAQHVVAISDEKSALEMIARLHSLKNDERMSLSAAHRLASTSCFNWFGFRNFPQGCYELDQFKNALDLFVAHKNPDPSIDFNKVEAKVGRDAVHALVHSGYLFYDPQSRTLKVRNKLFLDVIKEEYDLEFRMKALLQELQFWERLANDASVAADHREIAWRKKEEVEDKLAYELESSASKSKGLK